MRRRRGSFGHPLAVRVGVILGLIYLDIAQYPKYRICRRTFAAGWITNVSYP